ncbi:hypothetical protein DEJ37_17545 [Kocuria rosea]|nr:hypothetical protein DEJ37_17545 [Kocuria rosea]
MVDDQFWELIAPLLPEQSPHRGQVGGFGLMAGPRWRAFSSHCTLRCRWRDLPRALGCRSRRTAWRGLRHGPETGVREKLHAVVFEELSAGRILDWVWASIKLISVRAKMR